MHEGQTVAKQETLAQRAETPLRLKNTVYQNRILALGCQILLLGVMSVLNDVCETPEKAKGTIFRAMAGTGDVGCNS